VLREEKQAKETLIIGLRKIYILIKKGSGARNASEWDLQMRKRLQASPRRE
jgi:hypothetical protein